MTSKIKLKNTSHEFLKNSGEIYDYCIRGLTDLERIIVSTSSGLSDTTRGYLLPIVYAYWERFFTSIFGEYLRCIELAKLELTDLHPDMIKLKLRKQFSHYSKKDKINGLHMLAEKFKLNEIENFINKLSNDLKQPLSFPIDINWIETDSNVSAEVLKKVCNKFNVNFEDIKKQLKDKNIDIFPKLKELLNFGKN